MRMLLAVLLLSLVSPAGADAKSRANSKRTYRKRGRRVKQARRTKARRARRRARRRRRSRRRRVRRCRGVWCAAQVVRMDGSGSTKSQLREAQVQKIMRANQARLETCLVEARRRDPDAVSARIEFVVSGRGRVLASRVNGKHRSGLARCVHKRLRPIRFPRNGARRTLAGFTIALAR